QFCGQVLLLKSVHTYGYSIDEAYTSHNTRRLDVEGTVKKLLTTDYVQDELQNREHKENL
ncbi:hypothetical protein, partial [Megasphaera sp.]|uniref:hypothetical protein n=1 Tax=Megasphaera sp. TaxID=2023260 RepID=UPI0025C28EE6